MREKKPWPRDAINVIAARAGREIRERMEGVHPAACRDCGSAVHADTRTVRTAETHPLRNNRPVAFLCRDCAAGYAAPTRAVRHDLDYLSGVRLPCLRCGRGLDVGDTEALARGRVALGSEPIIVHDCRCGCRMLLKGRARADLHLTELTPADELRLRVIDPEFMDAQDARLDLARQLDTNVISVGRSVEVGPGDLPVDLPVDPAPQ